MEEDCEKWVTFEKFCIVNCNRTQTSQFHKMCDQCRKNTDDQSFHKEKYREAENRPAKTTTSFNWYNLKDSSGSGSGIITTKSLTFSSGSTVKESFSSTSGYLQIKSFTADKENFKSSFSTGPMSYEPSFGTDDIPMQSFPSTTTTIAKESFHSATGNAEEGIFLVPYGKSPDGALGSGSGEILKHEDDFLTGPGHHVCQTCHQGYAVSDDLLYCIGKLPPLNEHYVRSMVFALCMLYFFVCS